MCVNIKDYFLATLMQYPKYIRVRYKYIPDDIQEYYNLDPKVTNDGWLYIKI